MTRERWPAASMQDERLTDGVVAGEAVAGQGNLHARDEVVGRQRLGEVLEHLLVAGRQVGADAGVGAGGLGGQGGGGRAVVAAVVAQAQGAAAGAAAGALGQHGGLRASDWPMANEDLSG